MYCQYKQRGFTLVEVLMVMVIISIVGGITLLSFNYNQNARYEKIGMQIKQMLALSAEQSLLQTSVLGLGFSKKSFQIYQYEDQPTKTKMNPWREVAIATLGIHQIPKDVQITVKVHNKVIPLMSSDTAQAQPQLIIDTTGNIVPFTIMIGKTGAAPRYAINGAADGSITSGPMHG